MSTLNERVELRLNSEMLKNIDVWKTKNRRKDMTRSEVIRELVMNQTDDFSLTLEQRFLALLNIENLLAIEESAMEIFSNTTRGISHNENHFFDVSTLKLLKTTILEGHDWAIPIILNGVEFKSDRTEDKDFVYAVLDFFRKLNHSIASCSPEEQQTIYKADHYTFEGFDANNEPELYSICKFIIHDLHRYEEQSKVELEAYMPMRQRYEQYLERAKNINSPDYIWSFKEICQLLNI